MKKLHTLLTYISSNRVWLITLVCLDLFFVFLAWVAYPGDFLNLVGLMIFVSFVALVIPFACAIHRRSKIDTAFRRFLLEPDDTNEYLLCESTPASMHTYIHELAHHLRTQLEYVNEQQLKITDYESYIENWVHEIKKPLSLMTLLLDNRKDEMSPLVHTRMLYVRDHTRQNVEQILYFSRLGAVHKDYYFEPLPILETCKEAVEDNLSLLEEAHFSVTYSGNNCTAISDKKGFMFILGQIISNSVKYAAHDATPAIHFSVSDNKEIGQIVLSICDNGTGIPASDLPFVFDKGFTGDVGSYLSRSTPRKEADAPEFLSGLVENVTCGAPITAVIRNTNTRSGDYANLAVVPRPGHADYTAWVKYGGHADFAGGGAFSGRLTAPLCIAGGICLQLLKKRGIEIISRIASIGTVEDPAPLTASTADKPFPVVDDAAGEAMRAAIAAAKADGDSIGGVVECAVLGLPAGLGGPLFDGMEGQIASIVFGIPAVKGIEFGIGFAAARLRGSENNDPFTGENGQVRTATNHCGGILGGITDGMPLTFRAAFKPTPSIAREQQSVNLTTLTPEALRIVGRHDPCIVPRAVPCIEAAAAIAVYDALLGGN